MSNIKVTELDFDILKENLKDFLRGQDEFQDYDFEGSGLQILLDILSANTHYNAIYQNMVANEMFLDTAVLRESVVSRSKVLGYTPNSFKSSQAEITLSLVGSVNQVDVDDIGNQPSSINLPDYSNFSVLKDNTTYIFQNTEGVTLTNSGELDSLNRKIYTNTFTIKQGVMVEQDFLINYQENPNQRFIIDNDNVDISNLVVRLKEDQSSSYTVVSLADNVVEIDTTDYVYWVTENETGKYELYFGNGRIGKKLINNTEIKIQYLTTSGSIGNNIKSGFTFSDVLSLDGIDYVTHGSISQSSASFGGADKEGIEDIRFNSPKYYEMQNRSVTALDYKYLILDKYQNIESIKVWGGEDNDPVYYGRVFVSIKPKTGNFLTETAKESIINDIIKEYNVVTIDVEVVDPVITYVDVNTTVKYNLREVPAGEDYLKNEVLNTIKDFNQTNISKFDSYFAFSKLNTSIDNTSDSIKSNITSVKIKNRLEVALSLPTSYDLKYNTEVLPGTLESSRFTYSGFSNCFLEDDSSGTVKIYTYYNNAKKFVTNIGSITYTTGEIKLSNFSPTFINDGYSYIDFILTPRSFDISPVRNQLITIDENTINITMENISKQFLTQNNM